jgi:hypothetical protein
MENSRKMKDPRDYSGEAGPRKRIRDALLHCCWTRVILSTCAKLAALTAKPSWLSGV